MSTVISILELEYFLEFPNEIREQMNIKVGDIFYAYRDIRHTLTLSRIRPGKSKHSGIVTFLTEHGAVLPYGFLRRMRIRPGDAVELTVKHEKIMIQKGEEIPFFHSANKRKALELKLKQELEAPSRFFSQSFREDVHSVLAFAEWSDDVVSQLLQIPDLLQEIARVLHNDDAFSEYFEQRVTELTLEYLAKSPM